MLTAIGVIMTGALRVDAATVPFPQEPINDWGVNGPVYAVTTVGDTIYVGGEFDAAEIPAVNPNGPQSATRHNVAAFDKNTGDLLPFVANTDDPVYSIATNGTSVFIGGAFDSVNGSTRHRIAAVDATTGAVRSGFVANTNTGSGVIAYAMHVHNGVLYAGGNFTRINNIQQWRIARLNPTTGAPDTSFGPVFSGTVRKIQVAPNGNVYAGGAFTQVNDEDRPYLTALNPANGAALGPTFESLEHILLDIDVSDDGTQVFGATGGMGSESNIAQAWSTGTGDRQWDVFTDGDIQAIEYFGGNVYFGFHDGYEGDTMVKMLVADASTGDVENWIPGIDSGLGVWAIEADLETLVVGGEFRYFGEKSTNPNDPLEGLIRVNRLAILPSNLPPDVSPPGPVTNLRVTDVGENHLDIAWNAASDDVGISRYEIKRDGVVLGATSTTSFADSGLSAGTSYLYEVTAIDLANKRGPSVPLVARTAEKLIGLGTSWKFLDDGSNQGSAWRAVSFNAGSWPAGAAELGYGDGDETTTTDPAITTYFRRSFTVPVNTDVEGATVTLKRDDGAVVYVNGSEVARINMPGGAIGHTTLASSTAENAIDVFAVPESAFTTGTNVVAVEVHQSTPTSSDMSFDLELVAALMPQPPATPTGLTASEITSSSARLSWSAVTGADSYELLRNGAVVGSTQGITLVDTGLASASTFSYTVRAVADSLRSPPSAPVNVKTLAEGSGPPPGSGTFVDDDGSIFEADIEWLAAEGVTKGCNPPTNDRYCPDDPVTRGQMAAFLVRFLGLTDDGGGNSFVDDNGSIFETDIARLAAAGITKGCNPPTNDRYCPDDPVTRGQMAAFLVRALGLTDDGGGNSFVDDNGSVFEADIARLAAAGITKGCNPPVNDRFCPNDTVTRAQMAAFLHRADPYR